jgi:glycosyltransferase involved in cell wall biosynthesis
MDEEWTRHRLINRARSQVAIKTINKSHSVRFVSMKQFEKFESKLSDYRLQKVISPVPLNMHNSNVKLHLKNRNNSIGILSRLSVDRGLDESLQIIERINKLNQSFKLVIGGTGPYKEFFIGRLKDILGDDRVVYLGEVEPNKIEDYWDQVGVFLSMAPTESYGRSIREAAAHGVPIIATASSGVNSLVNENNGAVVTILESSMTDAQIVEHVQFSISAETTSEYFNSATENQKQSISLLTDSWTDLLLDEKSE